MLFPALVLCCSVLPAQAEQTTFQKLAEYLTENGLDLPDILTDSEGNPDWFIKPPAFIPNSQEYFVIDVRPDSVVAIVSSLGFDDGVQECLAAGAKDYLQKPFSKEDLLQFLRNLVAKP